MLELIAEARHDELLAITRHPHLGVSRFSDAFSA
jgi:hypothetical protein